MRGLALTLVGGAALLGAARASAQDLAAGAAVYGQQCGRCHAPRAPVEYSDRDWNVIMQHMRVIAVMTARDTRDVLAFLQASNGEEGTAATGTPAAVAPDTAAGRAQLEQLGCTGCHALGGTGGNLGPALDRVGSRRTADYLTRKIRNPRFDNSQSIMPALSLSNDQRARLVAYLVSLR